MSSPFGTQVFSYTGVQGVIERWAQFNGSSNRVAGSEKTLDLVAMIYGADTLVSRYETSPPGGSIELWTIPRMDHVFNDLTTEFREKVIQWMLQHPKP